MITRTGFSLVCGTQNLNLSQEYYLQIQLCLTKLHDDMWSCALPIPENMLTRCYFHSCSRMLEMLKCITWLTKVVGGSCPANSSTNLRPAVDDWSVWFSGDVTPLFLVSPLHMFVLVTTQEESMARKQYPVEYQRRSSLVDLWDANVID